MTIDALTPASNLTVVKLTISAPPGSTNTLLLNNADTNNPLVLSGVSSLRLMDGGAFRITNSALLLTLTNDHLDIDGALTLDSGSIVIEGDNTVTARVGRVTSGTLTINSGTVSCGVVKVGDLVNGLVNMNGGTFNISSLLSLGRNFGTTGMVSVLGGQLTVLGDDTLIGDSGVGQLTISNATVSLTNVDVGRENLSVGTLTVQNGGSILVSNDLSIGHFSGSTGTVFVTGGQLVGSGQKIYLGRGGSGQMTISSGIVQAKDLLVAADLNNTASGTLAMTGGNLNLSSSLLVGNDGFSTGQMTVTGGTITLTNPAGTALMSVPSGTVTFNTGTLTTDSLLLTNAAGQFVFNGGTLNTKSTTVANGAPFMVGDGVDAATFHMVGGTHSFANGLIISSNATLNGCGTIIGTIINHGTIATNCNTALVRPTITGQTKTGATNAISFTTVSGQIYTLEFKNALTDASWTAILPSTNGSGSVLTLKDIMAVVSTRFYHVRTQ